MSNIVGALCLKKQSSNNKLLNDITGRFQVDSMHNLIKIISDDGFFISHLYDKKHTEASKHWGNAYGIQLSYIGEFYRLDGLWKKIGRQESENIAELICRGYRELGPEVVDYLDGSFSVVLYDGIKKECCLIQDHVGTYKLYYYRYHDVLLFSSRLDSLLETELVPKIIDREALSRFLQLTYIPAPKSIIQDVWKVEPATVMCVAEDGAYCCKKYWQIEDKFDWPEYADYDHAKQALRATLVDAVSRRLPDDNLGAFLSGGFDSSIMVGIASQILNRQVDTFTIGYQERLYDESSVASIIAERNKTSHHVFTLTQDNVYQSIESVLEDMDEPYADSSLIAAYTVSQMARDYVKTVITGDAGDELFAGYNKYLITYYSDLYKKVPSFLRHGIMEPIDKILPKSSYFFRKVHKVVSYADMDLYDQRKKLLSLGFKEDQLKGLMNDGNVDSMDFIRQQYDYLQNADSQTKAQYVDLVTVLEGDMMTKMRNAYELTGLRTRSPMLDQEVVELAYKIPTKYKIDKKRRKIILKDTFRDILPEELFSAPKHGFAVPIGGWIETILQDSMKEYTNPEFLRQQGLFECEYIQEIVGAHFSHKENYYSELWAFFVFQNWYKKTIS